ncbi:NUDIX hydrolase [Aurantiacibacter sp. D1-12]|uniref:NUDIX hydrolase n=1 Tax=Aurantiacibacter sp. D1-12 TaxID=2993658 RepID=UPI00237C9353|nr:NUDIX domain-containing protein [Aurantiacibacter sp. D1-12]MDE1467655.1 NUDIX domain-containing protein [Aurantiacibacter sp. D1-12]
MLHLIPAWIQRPLMPAASKLRSLWRSVSRPTLYGVSVALFDDQGRLLLVRHSYGTRKWAMPAGGIGKREDPEAGLRREIREELAITLHDVRLVRQTVDQLQGLDNHVWFFTATAKDPPQPDMREVIAAQFFALDALPDHLEKRVRPRLDWVQESRSKQR